MLNKEIMNNFVKYDGDSLKLLFIYLYIYSLVYSYFHSLTLSFAHSHSACFFPLFKKTFSWPLSQASCSVKWFRQ